MANLLRTAHTLQHTMLQMRASARPHCRLKLPSSGTPAITRKIFILPETRVPDVHEGCCGIGVSVFTLTQ